MDAGNCRDSNALAAVQAALSRRPVAGLGRGLVTGLSRGLGKSYSDSTGFYHRLRIRPLAYLAALDAQGRKLLYRR